MDFEEKLIQDLGEEVRIIYPAAVYEITEDRVYLDILLVEKDRIECRGFSKSLFEKLELKRGTRLWVDHFTQPNKVIIKVKLVEATDDFPTLQFLKVLTENAIARPNLEEEGKKYFSALDNFSNLVF